VIWRSLGAVILVVTCVAYVATREHAPIVHVRWNPRVEASQRASLLRHYDLVRCSVFGERTDSCELLDTGRANIAEIVADSRIEDTYHIERAGLRVSPDADRETHVTWIAHRTPLTRVRGSIEAIVIIALALVLSGPVARRRARTRAEGRAFFSENITLALLALALFALLYLASSQIDVEGGLGYDGRVYAGMLERGFGEATRYTRMRPLIVLLTRIPYYFTQEVILSFNILNFACAFAQAYMVAKLADLYGIGRTAKIYLVVTLALCIATARMFAYYPVLIDLGADVLMLWAVYAILTGPLRVALLATSAAVMAREFGIGVAFFGMHRAWRRGDPAAMLTYVPAIVIFGVLRYIGATRGVQGYGIFELMVQSLSHWHEPWFVAPLVYFLMTTFGGTSMILFSRPRDAGRLFIEEPEWATFGATILGLALVYGIDFWRYFAFALPLAVVLFARASARWTTREQRWLYSIGAIGTWYTQRPFEHVSLVVYFRDWFPYYVAYLGSSPFPSEILWPVWRWRFPVTAALFVLLAASNIWRRRTVKTLPDVAPLPAI